MLTTVAILLLQGVWACVESSLQPERRWVVRGAERRLPLLAGFLTALVVVVALFDSEVRTPPWISLSLSIGMGGVALRAYAIRALGESFSDGVEWGPDQARVVGGVYRVRHPAEIGTLLILAATCSMSGSSLALAVLVCGVLPTSLLRVVREERNAPAQGATRS